MNAVLRILVVLGSLALCVGARAEARHPRLPAVVRIVDPGDGELLARVRGQTNDLDVTLSADESLPLEADLNGQLEGARNLAARYEARVVVWFVREETALTVFVSEPAAGRVLVRRLERGGEHMASSAQNEAAALVVRSAMRSLAQGGEIGVAEKEVAPPPPPPPPPPEPEPDPAPPPPPPPEPEWEVVAQLGVRGALDGASRVGALGVSGRLVFRYERFQAELRGMFGLPSVADERVARVELVRHGATVHGAFLPVVNEGFALALGAGGGVSIFRSKVAGGASGFDADDRALVVSALAADVTVRYLPEWAAHRVGLACTAGAEVLPNTPKLGYYDEDGDFRVRDRLWNVMPVLAVELAVRLK